MTGEKGRKWEARGQGALMQERWKLSSNLGWGRTANGNHAISYYCIFLFEARSPAFKGRRKQRPAFAWSASVVLLTKSRRRGNVGDEAGAKNMVFPATTCWSECLYYEISRFGTCSSSSRKKFSVWKSGRGKTLEEAHGKHGQDLKGFSLQSQAGKGTIFRIGGWPARA